MYDLSHVTLGAITETPESEFIMRRKKVDNAIQLLQMMSLMPLIKELG